MQRRPAVYIMANKRYGTLYTGVTSDLQKRIWQHRTGVGQGFAAKYACRLLVWYEQHATMEFAIVREKQLKGGSRAGKLRLIETMNPSWTDLFDEIAQC